MYTLLRMLFSRYQTLLSPLNRRSLAEKEVVRLALRLARPIRPMDVQMHFDVNHRTALQLLQGLCAQGLLNPVVRGKGLKVRHYELNDKIWDRLDFEF
jgi:hypothetical protein